METTAKQKTGMVTPAPPTVTMSALYMVFLSVMNFCGATAFLGLTSLGAYLNEDAVTEGLTELAELSASANQVFNITGYVALAFGIAFLAAAYGVYRKKSWGYYPTLLVNAAYIILTVVMGFMGGFQISALIYAALSAVILYLFLMDNDVKAAFGQ